MRLIVKRVERLNRYGDDLCIELQQEGKMRISPALQSRMGIPNSGNKVGFAYPEESDTEQIVNVYVAPDGNGVAVNNQGVLSNTPHNRDLRSHYEESSSENVMSVKPLRLGCILCRYSPTCFVDVTIETSASG